MTDQLRFDGRVAIVTGAGRGIGRAHALLLAERGAQVVVNDLGSSIDGIGADQGPADSVVHDIVSGGGVAVADGNDVSTEEGARQLVATTIDRLGHVDIVINNAGIIRWTEFPDAPLDELNRHLAVHVAGTFNVSRAAWPHLAQRGYGRIVNTMSTAVLGSVDLISYGTAKGGIVGLSRGLAHSGLEHGIGVNMISPMGTTRMLKPSPHPESGDDLALRERPVELVAAAVAFLAHESCHATGQMYVAGSGRVSRLFIGETLGYTNPSLSPEDVRDHWAAIQDETGYRVPLGTIDHGVEFERVIDAVLAGPGA